MLQHISPPPTQTGMQLELTSEQEQLCKVLYRETEDGRYIFDGLWAPGDNGDDGVVRIAVPVRSVIGPAEDYDMQATFANIVGSTEDPNPTSDSWIEVMRTKGIDCSACATDGGFYDPATGSCLGTIACKTGSTHLVAGHVTFGTRNQHTKDIKGTTVYLLPICKKHNTTKRYSNLPSGTGDCGTGFYMRPKAAGKVLTLYKYYQKEEE